MLKTFAIYQSNTYEVKTPLGPRQVKINKKVDELKQEVPDEMVEELNKMTEFDRSLVIEGLGQVLVQTPYGIAPQPISFVFGEEVKTYQQAFNQFDIYLSQEINRLKEEHNSNKIQKASEVTLRQIDAARNMNQKSPGGILMP